MSVSLVKLGKPSSQRTQGGYQDCTSFVRKKQKAGASTFAQLEHMRQNLLLAVQPSQIDDMACVRDPLRAPTHKAVGSILHITPPRLFQSFNLQLHETADNQASILNCTEIINLPICAMDCSGLFPGTLSGQYGFEV